MRILDTLGELADIGKDMISFPAKATEAAVEMLTGIGEAVAQEVTNIVKGEGSRPIKTSFDVKDEAKDIREKAREDHYKARERLLKKWDEYINQSKIVSKKRKEVYSRLGVKLANEILPALPDAFQTIPYVPAQDNDRWSDIEFAAGTYLGLAGINLRRNAAEQYLESANDYRLLVASQISEMNQVKRKLIALINAIKEEKKALKTILKVYDEKPDDLLLETAHLLQKLSEELATDMSDHSYEKYSSLVLDLNKLW